jgi:hypothetical protein
LFPTQSGEIVIDPTTLVIQGGFFDPDTRLETDPITVNVLPLPADAPEGFNGAVGDYTMNATVDAATVDVGDPVTLRITVKGSGNINALPDPVWQATDGWRSFDASSSINTEVTNGKLGGSKTIDYLLIPESGGDHVLPSASFTYFNPDDEQYHTIASDPVTVTVNGDALPSVAVAPENDTPVSLDETQTASLLPIRVTSDNNFASQRDPLTAQPIYWLAWSVPVLMILGSNVYTRRQRYLMANSASIRRSRAYKQAQKAIKQAKHNGHQPHEATGAILAQYIEAKLDIALNGLTHPQLDALLVERGVAEDNAHSALDTLYAVDTIRYGASMADEQILENTATLITTLEKEFNS